MISRYHRLEVYGRYSKSSCCISAYSWKDLEIVLAGFVCYGEKTHGSYIIPYISTTKSPQQIMGSIIKNWVRDHFKDRQIYHVTVMPCYDKKLEASREDFFNNESKCRDVDCVITASMLICEQI